MKIYLIRHGETDGNKKRRYIGARTDEGLCPDNDGGLRGLLYPRIDALYASPMKRCTQTASIIYPGMRIHIIDELTECDFGDFENKSARDMADDPRYNEWVNSGALLPFPGGESREEFSFRCVRAFESVITNCFENKTLSAAVIAHGGVIMAIMEEFAIPHRTFYEWHLPNGGGYEATIEENGFDSSKIQLTDIGGIPRIKIIREDK